MQNQAQSFIQERLGNCNVLLVVNGGEPVEITPEQALEVGMQLIQNASVADYVNQTHQAIREMAGEPVERDVITRSGGEIVDFIPPIQVDHIVVAEPMPGAGTPPVSEATPVSTLLEGVPATVETAVDGDHTPPGAFEEEYRLSPPDRDSAPREQQVITADEVGTVESLGLGVTP